MRYKYPSRVLISLFWLVFAACLPLIASAEAYEVAVEDLTNGEYRSAYKGFKRLAQRDHIPSQYQLGMLYLFGQGVKKDVNQGIDWLKRAADNGSYLAANELGQIYLSGREVAVDEQEAMKWVERATELAGQDEAEEGCD